MYGFAKNEQDDIDDAELEALRKLAPGYFDLSDADIEQELATGEIIEVELMSNKKRSVVSEPRAGYPSHLMKSIHESAQGLARGGHISKKSMREFDKLCLTPTPDILPAEIIELREREEASQAVLAWFLNVSTSVVSQWERGKKRPSGAALKLLHLARAKGLDAIK